MTSREHRSGGRAIVAVWVAVAAALVPSVALATTPVEDEERPGVRVEVVELGSDGTSEAIVSVAGLAPGETLTAADVTVVDDGVTIRDLKVSRVSGEPSAAEPAVVLAVDTSGSTIGAPLTSALEAATELAEALETAGVTVGLVEFGPDVEVRARLGDPSGSVTSALAVLTGDGGTALYDGIGRAARLLASHDGPRDIVVFSDGVDTTSVSDLAAARGLVVDEGIRVIAVALDTGDMDLAPLTAITSATGGEVIRVTDPAQLLAAFRGVAEDLTNRFVLQWTAELVPSPPTQLSFVVSVVTPAGVVSDDLIALNTRVPAITEPRAYEPTPPLVPGLGGVTGLAVGVSALFLSVLLGASLLLSTAGERRRRERLAATLDGWDGGGAVPDDAIVASASLSNRAADVVDRLPKPQGMEERLGVLLERADWPMRPSEFQLVTVATTFGGLVVALVLLRSVPAAVLLALLGAAGPYLALRRSVGRRSAQFEDQLPSVLMLLAGALRAGHGLSTAMEGVVRETDEPARSELRRASVEQRLGRSIDEALVGVADRVQSKDLQWVVNAIAIQQEVGGNLAELLDNVAATLRDRASLGRNVRALAAEGRYSAWIIGALPFVMFVVLNFTNPGYVDFLYSDPRGLAMTAIGFVLLVIGSLSLRKIVQPRF